MQAPKAAAADYTPQLVKDINPDNVSYPSRFTKAGNEIFFRCNDEVHGHELWRTDGTEAGTKPLFTVADDHTFLGTKVIGYGGLGFFTARSDDNGTEIWQTNNTRTSTKMTIDATPGSESFNPGEMTIVGQTMFLSGKKANGTQDLFKIDLPPADNTDLNNDNIPDGLQPYLARPTSLQADKPVAIQVGSECDITSSSITDEATQPVRDAGYAYPSGLASFSGTCNEPGFSTTVSLYLYGVEPDSLVLKKYNPTTQSYSTISDARLTKTTIEGEVVTVATYTLTDGGPLDQDGQVIGAFTDPIGAAKQSIAAPNTGLEPVEEHTSNHK